VPRLRATTDMSSTSPPPRCRVLSLSSSRVIGDACSLHLQFLCAAVLKVCCFCARRTVFASLNVMTLYIPGIRVPWHATMVAAFAHTRGELLV